MNAAKEGHLDVLKHLLDCGASPSYPDHAVKQQAVSVHNAKATAEKIPVDALFLATMVRFLLPQIVLLACLLFVLGEAGLIECLHEIFSQYGHLDCVVALLKVGTESIVVREAQHHHPTPSAVLPHTLITSITLCAARVVHQLVASSAPDLSIPARTQDDGLLLECAASKQDVTEEMEEIALENGYNFDDDGGCGDPDCAECGGGIMPQWLEAECRWDLQHQMNSLLREVIETRFEQRGLVQAHRRLALAAATNDRLGSASPLRGMDMGVLLVLIEDHLLVKKPRMPGARVTTDTQARFQQQGWAWETRNLELSVQALCSIAELMSGYDDVCASLNFGTARRGAGGFRPLEIFEDRSAKNARHARRQGEQRQPQLTTSGCQCINCRVQVPRDDRVTATLQVCLTPAAACCSLLACRFFALRRQCSVTCKHLT